MDSNPTVPSRSSAVWFNSWVPRCSVHQDKLFRIPVVLSFLPPRHPTTNSRTNRAYHQIKHERANTANKKFEGKEYVLQSLPEQHYCALQVLRPIYKRHHSPPEIVELFSLPQSSCSECREMVSGASEQNARRVEEVCRVRNLSCKDNSRIWLLLLLEEEEESNGE